MKGPFGIVEAQPMTNHQDGESPKYQYKYEDLETYSVQRASSAWEHNFSGATKIAAGCNAMVPTVAIYC